jgi:hypothetical protein
MAVLCAKVSMLSLNNVSYLRKGQLWTPAVIVHHPVIVLCSDGLSSILGGLCIWWLS